MKEDIYKTIQSEKSGTTAEDVAARLREMIYGGELSAGDRLPPERDLAKLLGVSRPTLRAGIRSLAAIGILQSRQGAGTFVTEAEESPTLDGGSLKMLAALYGFTPDEMFEARLSLEMSVAAFAAERATSKQLAQMTEEIDGMFANLDAHEKFRAHERSFHRTVAAASGNRVLTALMNMLAETFFDFPDGIAEADLKEIAESCRRICRAIREGNIDSARNAARDHRLRARHRAQ